MSGIYLPDAPIVPYQAVNAGTVLGPFPCADQTSTLILFYGPLGVGTDRMTCIVSWDDLPTPTFALGLPRYSVPLVCDLNGQLFAQLRHAGATVRYRFTGGLNGYVVSIGHSDRSMNADGPHTPGMQNQAIGSWQNTLGAFATATHPLYGNPADASISGYCGPAILSCQTNSANANGMAWLQDDITGLHLGGCSSSALNPGSASVVVPPRPCSVVVENVSANAGIGVWSSLVAT